jgi:tetratricopeptide (TPR) repeat protein
MRPQSIFNSTESTEQAVASVAIAVGASALRNATRAVRWKRRSDAAPFYRFVSEASDELETAMIEVGITFATSAQTATARACWMELLRDVNSSSFDATMNVGQSYTDEGNFEEAVDWFTTAIDLPAKPDKRAICLYNRGLAYVGMERIEDAIEDYAAAIRLNRNLGMAYNNIGACYLNRGDTSQAEKWFRSCLALEDDVSEQIGMGDAKALARMNLEKRQ